MITQNREYLLNKFSKKKYFRVDTSKIEVYNLVTFKLKVKEGGVDNDYYCRDC